MTSDNHFERADIFVDPELDFSGDNINAYIETWFDVDARFGTHIHGTDDTFNFYAAYYPEQDRLHAFYILHGDNLPDEGKPHPVDLSPAEESLIRSMMDEVCTEEFGTDMKQAWEAEQAQTHGMTMEL